MLMHFRHNNSVNQGTCNAAETGMVGPYLSSRTFSVPIGDEFQLLDLYRSRNHVLVSMLAITLVHVIHGESRKP